MIVYAYFGGVVLTFFWFTRVFWQHIDADDPNVEGLDKYLNALMALLGAALACWFWPLAVLIVACESLLFPASPQRKEIELEKKVHEQQQRISELEREAGIR